MTTTKIRKVIRKMEDEIFKGFSKSPKVGEFTKLIKVLHQDRSKFKLYHARYKRVRIGDFDYIAVETEHNGRMFFNEVDLEKVTVQDMYKKRSKEKRLKLQSYF